MKCKIVRRCELLALSYQRWVFCVTLRGVGFATLETGDLANLGLLRVEGR